ncbi:MAG TPA: hypothetical protein VGH74_02525 [Planctomycetaceae bacterium]
MPRSYHALTQQSRIEGSAIGAAGRSSRSAEAFVPILHYGEDRFFAADLEDRSTKNDRVNAVESARIGKDCSAYA